MRVDETVNPHGNTAWHQPAANESAAKWHAIWTRSNFEKQACDQLEDKGFHPLLPLMSEWSVRAGKPHRIRVPMFPGYLFLHDTLDKHGYLEVMKTRGVVSLLGSSWDRLAEIPELEMAAVDRLGRIDLPMRVHPFLRDGERVRIHHGPLAGLEGIILRANPRRQLFVVSVELLRRSVAVEVECAFVQAV